MARQLQPRCLLNPKTGRPFTRHSYRPEGLRVESYVRMTSGEMAPRDYAFELVCKRCGYTETARY